MQKVTNILIEFLYIQFFIIIEYKSNKLIIDCK